MNIRKSIMVRRPVETAFTAFTEEIGRWWPLKQFSFGGERAKEIYLEGKVGGRLYERFKDGDEFTIGTVSLFDAPNRVTFTWQQPNWHGPTVVDVSFTPVPEGTLVELEHRDWETAGVSSEAASGYEKGWGFILGLFSEAQQS